MRCKDPGISSPRKNTQQNVTTLQQKTASANTDTNATDVFYTYLGNLPGVFIRPKNHLTWMSQCIWNCKCIRIPRSCRGLLQGLSAADGLLSMAQSSFFPPLIQF